MATRAFYCTLHTHYRIASHSVSLGTDIGWFYQISVSALTRL